MRPKRLWARIQRGHVQNIDFNDFETLLEAFGFKFARQSGSSHKIFLHPHIKERINVQPRRDGSAKPYQVRQLAQFVRGHGLKLNDEE